MKNLRLHNVSIYIIFNQNRLKNKYDRFFYKRALSDLLWPLRLYFMFWKNLVFIILMLAFLNSFDNIWFKQKRNPSIKWPYVHCIYFEIILHFIEIYVSIHNKFDNIRLYIHLNFYQNWLINEDAKKTFTKLPESQSSTVFFVRCYDIIIWIINNK